MQKKLIVILLAATLPLITAGCTYTRLVSGGIHMEEHEVKTAEEKAIEVTVEEKAVEVTVEEKAIEVKTAEEKAIIVTNDFFSGKMSIEEFNALDLEIRRLVHGVFSRRELPFEEFFKLDEEMQRAIVAEMSRIPLPISDELWQTLHDCMKFAQVTFFHGSIRKKG